MMKLAKSFYLKLYLSWAGWVSFSSLLLALILSLSVTVLTYISKGLAPLEKKTFLALEEIFFFSFPISFSLSAIIMLLLVFKAVFNWKVDGCELKLYDCNDDVIVKPLISDVIMIWRKWLFLTVWSLILFFLLFLGLWKLFTFQDLPLQWLNGVNIYLLILLFGGLIFSLGIVRCKRIRINRCLS